MNSLSSIIKTKKVEIEKWLQANEDIKNLPLYSSVDIRDAGFKVAVVDTNLFPAGFNNLCEHGQSDSVKFIKQAILERVPHCSNILIVAEEHTRNTWYLENIRVLQNIINQAGFHAIVATFLYVQPEFCFDTQYVELETAVGHPLRIHCFQRILREIKADMKHFDLIILNNDLSTGIPEVLTDAGIPIYPSIQAGWHSRHKSLHFKYTAELMDEFSRILGVDPWFLSCLSSTLEGININEEKDRMKLADVTAGVLEKIQSKYAQHALKEEPFVFIKSDSGTYGMGVLPVSDPDEIIELNRKDRNRLYKGKGSQIISRYIIQEGVPTVHKIDGMTSEVCIYQIANNLAGSFYRSHREKSTYDNLNSPGMEFKPMCPHPKENPSCGIPFDQETFDLYRILGRIASIAAYKEIIQLETAKK